VRAFVQVAVPGAPRVWSALIDTGGRITVVRSELLDEGGDPVDIGPTMVLRLGGSSNEVALFELTLEIRPPSPFGEIW
jgi:hypothetical protein